MSTTEQNQNQQVDTETPDSADSSTFSRRNVLAVGAMGAAGVALAACSSGSSGSSATSPAGTASGSAGASASAGVITPVSKVPVGGAVIAGAADTKFVVSQQTAGKVECYSAVCPHEGCLCNMIQGEDAVCPCHGSRFNVFTGAVTQGPATTGLTKVNVTVAGGNVVAG